MVGFTEDMIHMYNKNEHAVHSSSYFERLKGRNNVILMGDNVGDLHMADGVESPNVVLKIGFLNQPVRIACFFRVCINMFRLFAYSCIYLAPMVTYRTCLRCICVGFQDIAIQTWHEAGEGRRISLYGEDVDGFVWRDLGGWWIAVGNATLRGSSV